MSIPALRTPRACVCVWRRAGREIQRQGQEWVAYIFVHYGFGFSRTDQRPPRSRGPSNSLRSRLLPVSGDRNTCPVMNELRRRLLAPLLSAHLSKLLAWSRNGKYFCVHSTITELQQLGNRRANPDPQRPQYSTFVCEELIV